MLLKSAMAVSAASATIAEVPASICEIEHRANRGGDQHHADHDENGTDATHAVHPSPATGATQFPAADSRRSRLMFMTARPSAQLEVLLW
jgi:hypothetical protein